MTKRTRITTSKFLLPLLSVGAALLVTTLASGEAKAQHRSSGHGHGQVSVAIMPPGVYVGAGLVGMKILSQGGGAEVLEDGAGFSLYAGMQLNERLALEAGIASSFHNPVEIDSGFANDVDYLVLTAATVDAKIFFPKQRQRIVPFAQGGVGLYLLDSENFGAQSVGSGFQLGGGFQMPLGPRMDFGLRALYRGISMGPPEGGSDDTFVSALSAEANLNFHF